MQMRARDYDRGNGTRCLASMDSNLRYIPRLYAAVTDTYLENCNLIHYHYALETFHKSYGAIRETITRHFIH